MKCAVLDFAGLTLIVVGGAIFACGSILLRKAKR